MTRIIIVLGLLSVTACATNNFEGAAACTRTPGCVSSFAATGEGPIHAQAAAPVSAPGLQPQR